MLRREVESTNGQVLYRRNALPLLVVGISAPTMATACGIEVPNLLPSAQKQITQPQSPEMYLKLPFRKSELDLERPYEVSEGPTYSDEEQRIHGMIQHLGVDLDVPYGTTLVAPCDGLAVASYQTIWPPSDRERSYQGRRVRVGFGFFVEIRVEERGRIVQLGHFSEIDKAVPFHEPKYNPDTDNWDPQIFNLPTDQLKSRGLAIAVRRGQELGRVGYSGLEWGDHVDFTPGNRMVVLPQQQNISWDQPHVHFEEAHRSREGAKSGQRDPYDIYKQREDYPSPSRLNKRMGQHHLWILGSNGLPDFAA